MGFQDSDLSHLLASFLLSLQPSDAEAHEAAPLADPEAPEEPRTEQRTVRATRGS
jgi:hypothetical protein